MPLAVESYFSPRGLEPSYTALGFPIFPAGRGIAMPSVEALEALGQALSLAGAHRARSENPRRSVPPQRRHAVPPQRRRGDDDASKAQPFAVDWTKTSGVDEQLVVSCDHLLGRMGDPVDRLVCSVEGSQKRPVMFGNGAVQPY